MVIVFKFPLTLLYSYVTEHLKNSKQKKEEIFAPRQDTVTSTSER